MWIVKLYNVLQILPFLKIWIVPEFNDDESEIPCHAVKYFLWFSDTELHRKNSIQGVERKHYW